jgi:hypothetical protein
MDGETSHGRLTLQSSRSAYQDSLSSSPVERIHILRAGVPQHQRRVVGVEAEPIAPQSCGVETLQIHYLLKFAVADSDSEDRWVLWITDKVHLLSVVRPVVSVDWYPGQQIGPLAGFEIEQNQFQSASGHSDDVSSVR